jgi:hypothetical protein
MLSIPLSMKIESDNKYIVALNLVVMICFLVRVNIFVKFYHINYAVHMVIFNAIAGVLFIKIWGLKGCFNRKSVGAITCLWYFCHFRKDLTLVILIPCGKWTLG